MLLVEAAVDPQISAGDVPAEVGVDEKLGRIPETVQLNSRLGP